MILHGGSGVQFVFAVIFSPPTPNCIRRQTWITFPCHCHQIGKAPSSSPVSLSESQRKTPLWNGLEAAAKKANSSQSVQRHLCLFLLPIFPVRTQRGWKLKASVVMSLMFLFMTFQLSKDMQVLAMKRGAHTSLGSFLGQLTNHKFTFSLENPLNFKSSSKFAHNVLHTCTLYWGNLMYINYNEGSALPWQLCNAPFTFVISYIVIFFSPSSFSYIFALPCCRGLRLRKKKKFMHNLRHGGWLGRLGRSTAEEYACTQVSHSEIELGFEMRRKWASWLK